MVKNQFDRFLYFSIILEITYFLEKKIDIFGFFLKFTKNKHFFQYFSKLIQKAHFLYYF